MVNDRNFLDSVAIRLRQVRKAGKLIGPNKLTFSRWAAHLPADDG